MSQRVLLFYQTDVKFGGWPTDAVHLFHGLQAAGATPLLVRAGAKKQRVGKFGRGLPIHEVPTSTAVAWAKAYPSLVVVSAPKQAGIATELVQAGAALLVHDPTEWKGGCLDAAFAAVRQPVLVHRQAVARALAAMGHASELVLHPYHAVGVGAGVAQPPLAARRWQAVAISRVDFDKRTHTIVEANGLLPEQQQVAIHGALNRIYEYHQLRKMHPEWRRHYHGKFSSDSVWAGMGIAQQARLLVDMSVIKGDGGGTQMTTLEALDAGCGVVLNTEWLTGDPEVDEVRDVATFVETAEQLAAAVAEPTYPDPDAVQELLQRHSAARIGADVLRLLTT